MSRQHALELVLADEGDAAVRARWDQLEQAGLPSLARHRGTTHRPHLTVVSSSEPPPPDVLELAQRRFGALLPVRCTADGLVLLGGRRLVVAELLGISTAARAAQAELVHAWPGADERPWLPHVSLTRRVDRAEAGAAVELLAGDDAEGAGLRVRTLSALRWWNPDREVVSLVAGIAA